MASDGLRNMHGRSVQPRTSVITSTPRRPGLYRRAARSPQALLRIKLIRVKMPEKPRHLGWWEIRAEDFGVRMGVRERPICGGAVICEIVCAVLTEGLGVVLGV